MIVEEFKMLKDEFKRIKKMGYVKSTRGGCTGIGKTFEDLLGKEEDALGLPDYHGIEIKTKRAYSNAYTTLFNATPMGQEEFQTKRISRIYGYPDKVLKNYKVLNVSFNATNVTLVGQKFLFQLEVNRNDKKIYLVVLDKNLQLIEKEAFWSFDVLKEKIERKMKYLAFVNAWPKTINNIVYYKYYKIDFYILKSFDCFLDLIEKGVIRVTFKISVFRNGNRFGEMHDRGTGFEIKESHLTELFEYVEL